MGLVMLAFSIKMLDGAGIKKLLNSISYAGLVQKKFFSLKMIVGACM